MTGTPEELFVLLLVVLLLVLLLVLFVVLLVVLLLVLLLVLLVVELFVMFRSENNPLIAWETMFPLGSEANCQNIQPVLNPLCL